MDVGACRTFDRTYLPLHHNQLSSVEGVQRTNVPSSHTRREEIISVGRLVSKPCCHNELGIPWDASLGSPQRYMPRRSGYHTRPDIGLHGSTQETDRQIWRIYWSSRLANRVPYLDCESRSIVGQVLSGYEHIAPGTIVLCYFNAVLLKVSIHDNHPSRVEDLFLLVFFHHLEPFPLHNSSRVAWTGGCCTSCSWSTCFLAAFFHSTLFLFLASF